jgi:integrase
VHAQQWEQTLRDFVSAVIGMLPVDVIDTQAILKVLTPIWTSQPVTASRVRGRVEAVLAAATVNGHRNGANPAAWKHHLDQLLPRPSKVKVVRHHRSLPYQQLPEFVQALRQQDAKAAPALEFAILTAARASEVTGMVRAEVDFDTRTWTIPGHRMKSGKPHRVPLADRALALVTAAAGEGERVFPVAMPTLNQLIKRMQVDACTHGFRSSFRTWCAEQTSFAAELIEQCLAHRTGTTTELAYQRSDQLEKRRALMQAWADFTQHKSAEVVQLRSAS